MPRDVLVAAQSQVTGAPVEAFKALTSTPRVELSLRSTRCPGIFGDSLVVPAMMPMVMDDDDDDDDDDDGPCCGLRKPFTSMCF